MVSKLNYIPNQSLDSLINENLKTAKEVIISVSFVFKSGLNLIRENLVLPCCSYYSAFGERQTMHTPDPMHLTTKSLRYGSSNSDLVLVGHQHICTSVIGHDDQRFFRVEGPVSNNQNF